MRDFDLKRLQNVELEMLKDVAEFCDNNEIVYFIDSGTLLGAVRHEGFIPWDDDIDICMDLKNYQKFCKLAPDGLPSKYFVQNYHTDPKACIRWSRVRINGTTSMERSMLNYDIHYGICMDVFLMVGRANTKTGKKIQDFSSRWLNTFLSKYSNLAMGVKLPFIVKLIYKFIPNTLRELIIKVLEKFVYLPLDNREQCFNTWYLSENAAFYPSYYFSKQNRKKIKFEDSFFWATENSEDYLETTYGDWKCLPPENERGGHGDIIVDFERDYTYYQNSSDR